MENVSCHETCLGQKKSMAEVHMIKRATHADSIVSEKIRPSTDICLLQLGYKVRSLLDDASWVILLLIACR